ncbi:MAG: hypothetical protein QM820_10215 [Minicystis sp.]
MADIGLASGTTRRRCEAELGQAHAAEDAGRPGDGVAVVVGQEACVRRALAAARGAERGDADGGRELTVLVAVDEARVLFEQPGDALLVLAHGLVVEEVVGEPHLVVVGEHAQRVIVDADVLRASLDVEVLLQHGAERGRRLGRRELVLLGRGEQAPEAVDVAAEIRVRDVTRGGRAAGVRDLFLEPGQDRRRFEATHALRKRAVVVGAVDEPDALRGAHRRRAG